MYHAGEVNEIIKAAVSRTIAAKSDWRARIQSDPGIVRGKPCIKGTRIPAALVLGYLAAGKGVKEIIREFPDLKAADVTACLYYAQRSR